MQIISFFIHCFLNACENIYKTLNHVEKLAKFPLRFSKHYSFPLIIRQGFYNFARLLSSSSLPLTNANFQFAEIFSQIFAKTLINYANFLSKLSKNWNFHWLFKEKFAIILHPLGSPHRHLQALPYWSSLSPPPNKIHAGAHAFIVWPYTVIHLLDCAQIH